jgi:subtilase family serine protease
MTIPARLRASLLFILSLSIAGSLAAQGDPPRPGNRIAANADLSPRTRLTGNLPRWVTPEADAGAVPDATPLHVTLMLSRGAEQEAAFTQMLADQQNPSSPRYHQWLTPAQIGEQFGPTMDDIAAVTGWLTRQGLHVDSVAPSRIFVEVSGTTGTVGAALGTSFHSFLLDGQKRVAATAEPAIPSALAVAVSGIDGLAEIPLRAFHGVMAAEPRAAGDGLRPMGSGSNNTVHYVYPGDFAQIYDVTTTSGGVYAGKGVKVAIIGRSQIASSDITLLEGIAGLPLSTPNVIIPPLGSDPGYVTTTGDQDESTLDVGRVLTVAPGAQADLIVSANSATTSGLTIAMQYNINTLLDPVMTISYGACESQAGSTNVHFFDTLFQQGAAEGISTFVSSGDSEAAGCSTSGAVPKGTEVLGINYLCSSSSVTCVGGTEFNDASNYGLYWSATNSSTYTSALGYIPEGAWNEPSYQKTANGMTSTVYQILGTGGGASLIIAKPPWQAGTGVPSDGARDTPDISFTSAGHDPYFACLAYKGTAYDCSGGGGTLFYGTSAAAPDMAAVAAILNQKAGKAQGNLNPVLYSLASSTPSAFHDATPASSGVVPCTVTTASMCNNSTPGVSGLSGLSGYPLQVGYDLSTGLGSLDVTNFVNAAISSSLLSTTTSVSAQPTTIVAGKTAVFSATVKGTTSATTTGTVQFYSNGTALGSPVNIANGAASTPATVFNTPGTYTITATYSGDSNNAASTSTALSFVVTAATPVGLAVSGTPTALTVSAGATTGNTSNIAVTTTGAYYGSVALTCSVSYSGGTATYPPTCSIAPASLTFTGGLSGSSVLTIATTIPHAKPGSGTSARNTTRFAPLGGIGFAALLLLLIPSRRRGKIGLLALLPIVLLGVGMMALAGCGSGSSPATTTTTPVGTSKGTYTVLVTATPAAGTAVTATPSITLTVQ